MWASLPEIPHLPGPESPSFRALVPPQTGLPRAGGGGCTVGYVCDQDLGPEKGRELLGPPRWGAKPWPFGEGWEPPGLPQRPVGTRQDRCPLPCSCQEISSLETPQPKPQPVGPLSPNLL